MSVVGFTSSNGEERTIKRTNMSKVFGLESQKGHCKENNEGKNHLKKMPKDFSAILMP